MLLMGAILSMNAQNETQALRYSQYFPFGTARYAAQGGAIGALGADLTSMVTNPAGLAFYRSSEFSVTPSFYWVDTRKTLICLEHATRLVVVERKRPEVFRWNVWRQVDLVGLATIKRIAVFI